MSIFFFPSSNYLKTKWWHRLALVIQWGCLCVIAAALFMNVYDGKSSEPEFIMVMIIIFSFSFAPTIAYRALLFVTLGDSWKDSNESKLELP